MEDQYVVGDTIQVGETLGRVEHVTLRRTVLRDARGALMTISDGDIRTVGNLSRDWSQAFVDIALAPESPVDKTLLALEAAAAELRADPSWSQALVDGPRILGVQSIDRSASTVRLQVRTVPTRQDEVARELRRRIQIEFQKQGIPLSSVQRFEWANLATSSGFDSAAARRSRGTRQPLVEARARMPPFFAPSKCTTRKRRRKRGREIQDVENSPHTRQNLWEEQHVSSEL